MTRRINKVKLMKSFFYILWIIITIILINLPSILGDKFSLKLGRTILVIYIFSTIIIGYAVNDFLKKSNNK
ncbi:hypothetical protein QJR26_18080 (plasmid) [Clostridium baratii]